MGRVDQTLKNEFRKESLWFFMDMELVSRSNVYLVGCLHDKPCEYSPIYFHMQSSVALSVGR